MKLTIVGSGDAFGSGGRLQSCYHVALPGEEFLIDCGATSMIGMQRFGLDPDRATEPVARAGFARTSYRKKLLQYQEVVTRRLYQRHFGTSSLIVLHVTVSEARKQALMQALKDITRGRGSCVHLFKVMKGDWMEAPPADGFTEPWARAGYPPLKICEG